MKGFFGRALPTLLLILGAAAISAGIALIYQPAGMIAAGVFMIAAGVLTALGTIGSADQEGGGGDG